MLYDTLAVLWAGPATQGEIALGIAARTRRFPSEEVCDGHLWFLTQVGFVEMKEHEKYGALYALTESGSSLLAMAADEESNWSLTR